MQYDFTTLNTGGGVHPFAAEHGVTDPGIITFSVAEMRLELAPEIKAAMHRVVEKGCFGYAPPDKDRFLLAVTGWMNRRHQWTVSPEWIVMTSGVVSAMGAAVRSMSQPGDGIIIQTPIYPPFARSITGNGRRIVENPLICTDGRYTMDLDNLEKVAKDARMLMLCSPHNPVGRVWNHDELAELGRICLENDLYVVSDEIHFDLDFTGTHTVLAEAVPELRDRSVICTAPSKTFNLAGCALSSIVIQNPELRRKFTEDFGRTCGMYVNTFAYAAATAAYEEGASWLEALLSHLQSNRQLLKERLCKLIPGAVFSPLEGTYLQWIDLQEMEMSQNELMAMLERAQIFVNDGTSFGTGGDGHIRFNLACPAASIEQAMERLEAVLAEKP